MGLRRLLFGSPAPVAPSGPAWLDVAPGDAIPSRHGRPAVVRSVAVYEARDAEDPDGDLTHHVLVWSDEGGHVETLLVQHDSYVGDDVFDVTTLHDLEAADPREWTATASLGPAELVRPHAAARASPGEVQPVTRLRAAGPDAAACPAEAQIVLFFRADRPEMDRFWLVLYDRRGVALLTFDATSQPSRAGGWQPRRRRSGPAGTSGCRNRLTDRPQMAPGPPDLPSCPDCAVEGGPAL